MTTTNPHEVDGKLHTAAYYEEKMRPELPEAFNFLTSTGNDDLIPMILGIES